MAQCGAKNRRGHPCKRSAMPNGRCNLHGGKSPGPPKGNQNARKWGFSSQYLMPTQFALMQEIDTWDAGDILWYNILLSYSAIIQAQKLASPESGASWELYGNFMQAQARAQAELRGLIKDFTTMTDEQDVRRLKVQLMQTEIARNTLEIEILKSPGGPDTNDDGFIEALRGNMKDTWTDEDYKDTGASEEAGDPQTTS